MNVLDLIGETPLVELKKVNPNPDVKLSAKLEMFNPGGSVKDRIAKEMIETAEKSGELTKDKTILEPTSGNTGIGLALVAAVKGYKIALVMPRSVSMERRRILRALGAKILLTPGKKGTDGAIEKAYELARKGDRYFMPDQFNNPANALAHFKTTGPEIWRQTKGKVTAFVAGMGTGGTLMGVGKFLKEKGVKVIGVEPKMGHHVQGLKNMKEAYKPSIYDKHLLDQKVNFEDEDAFQAARELAKKEGILAGMSSGAALHIAIEKANELKRGVVVVMFPDGGERYLSTNLFKSTGGK